MAGERGFHWIYPRQAYLRSASSGWRSPGAAENVLESKYLEESGFLLLKDARPWGISAWLNALPYGNGDNLGTRARRITFP